MVISVLTACANYSIPCRFAQNDAIFVSDFGRKFVARARVRTESGKTLARSAVSWSAWFRQRTRHLRRDGQSRIQKKHYS
ncbi:MAG: hypothetical protein DME63_06230 [Verrucomicrobia bacterium]|nr:MAG: hypothetical protein DME63_06230 [Verrucomicrobiota bacterium]